MKIRRHSSITQAHKSIDFDLRCSYYNLINFHEPGTVPGGPGAPNESGLLGADPYDDLNTGKKLYRTANFGLAERYFRRAVEARLYPRMKRCRKDAKSASWPLGKHSSVRVLAGVRLINKQIIPHLSA